MADGAETNLQGCINKQRLHAGVRLGHGRKLIYFTWMCKDEHTSPMKLPAEWVGVISPYMVQHILKYCSVKKNPNLSACSFLDEWDFLDEWEIINTTKKNTHMNLVFQHISRSWSSWSLSCVCFDARAVSRQMQRKYESNNEEHSRACHNMSQPRMRIEKIVMIL